MDHQDTADEVSDRGFRSVMAGLPSSVVVVTTVDPEGGPQGVTCSTLCAVSQDPPLLLVCIPNDSRTLAALQDRGLFVVNMLHKHGDDAARVFAAEGHFRSVLWAPSRRDKLPLLIDDAHCVAECRVWSVVAAGDHTVVIGEVRSYEKLRSVAPLLSVPPEVSA
ncbi:flavin reductase (DIM6/NTAB) family NADH-FMN oxidoreductase RutF [Kibdelosporangium banguiense]|uniref:Flavin reductase (DIM6/NTAB) family NADH-FMN oxidoreductase RutF n=1 Tax=Kibdelosporangium banguiense TaxID=1365924 RepID=A0ABS4TQX5_9PSEU|nr:flavin reductase family protein [Kibdelosporangium banguiense]MBP2326809.1 flavin reductase (DIM6/NTAB) family NADH-FMN oxidoreductase RutF [Kibdelosporangium banguiense]